MLNRLVLPMLRHWLNTLSPAPGILAWLQRLALEFFGPGLHWVSMGVLSLPLEEVGQDLAYLRSQVHVFWHQALRRLLGSAGSVAFLHRLCGLCHAQQLFFPFYLKGLSRDFSELPVFYQDLLWAWKLVSATRCVVVTE